MVFLFLVFFALRYDGPRKMRVVLGNMHGNNADVEAETSLLHRMLRGSLDAIEEPVLVNRNPRWNAKVSIFALFSFFPPHIRYVITSLNPVDHESRRGPRYTHSCSASRRGKSIIGVRNKLQLDLGAHR